MGTSTVGATTQPVNGARLAKFAPPQLRGALEEATREGLDIERLRAMLPGYRDDFESTRYLEAAIGRATVVLQPDLAPGASPTSSKAAAAAQAKQRLDETARAIAKATGMPAANALLFAEAGYSVEQAQQAHAKGVPAGQALVLHAMGVETEAAIALGSSGHEPRTVYRYLKAGVPAEHVVEAIERNFDLKYLPAYQERGFTAPEAIELAARRLYPGAVPPGVTFEQIEAAHARGVSVPAVSELIDDGSFTFEQACTLVENLGPYARVRDVKDLAAEQLSVEEIIERLK
ncbi:MAG: hypothetical protein IPJ65_07655 [Archangiaceae bacterium]|nr:hypothetical protein [Archangiaceae bacterium]